MKSILWRTSVVLSLAVLFTSLAVAQTESTTGNTNDPFHSLHFRNLGPAVGGGRVTSVTGIPGQPNTFYVGAAAGGVFKTTDGGNSFKPIFEHEAVASIGAIAVAPSNPSLVWVGTGETNPRNDVVTGRGVYFSPDAGATWKFMGLGDTAQIATIIVHPANPDVVYVAALGHIWGPNSERGVFRTSDGGKSWQKVLYVNDKTGAISLVMDPGNPMVLFAAMYEMQRYPWMMVSGGDSSGIYRSKDGGNSWAHLSDGLPKGPIGRIGLAAATTNPNHIYALVEAKRGVLWESLDLGDHWREVSDNKALAVRGFYFSQLQVSPENENHVFFISFDVMESFDGGHTAKVATRGNHVDNHALWIDPTNPDRIIQGNDGGVYLSLDGAKSWRYLDTIPIEQFYMVATDDETPYLVCGGLQDNNGWCGPSNTLSRNISGADWFQVTGGDGEYIVPAGHKTNVIYTESQNGSIQRLELTSGHSLSIRPYLHGVEDFAPSDLKYRFNWTTPIAVSQKDANDVYIGGNVLFHSTDGGRHWQPISPDLTRNDKSKQQSSGGPVELDLSGAETFGCILSISLSPVDSNVIWVGTDDGVVQMTRDGGKTWNKVSDNIQGLPQWGRLQQIEASPFDANTAYAAFDFHEVDNNHPYAFKTHDGGKTWTPIAKGLPDTDPARVIRENPNRKGFLVAGTDTGLFYSQDDGANWTALKAGFPTVPVYDVQYHKQNHDLLVATHGRGMFILDDIRPIEELTSQVASSDFHVFSTPVAYRWAGGKRSGGNGGGFTTPNPVRGAVITYYLGKAIEQPGQGNNNNNGGTAAAEQAQGGGRGGRGGAMAGMAGGRGPVKIAITDSNGQAVRTIYGPGAKGVNRTTWDMSYEGATRLNFLNNNQGEEENPFAAFRNAGPPVLPGTYTATLTAEGKTEKTTIQVEPDPRLPFDLDAAKAQLRAALELRSEVSTLNIALNRAESLHSQITSVVRILGAAGDQEAGVRETAYTPVIQQARAVDRKVRNWEQSVYNTEAGQDSNARLHYLSTFNQRLEGLMRAVAMNYDVAPNEALQDEMANMRKQLGDSLAQFNALLNEVNTFNKAASEKGAATLFAGGPVELKSDAGATTGGGGQDDQN
ncbi:MAG: hypothetical protein JO041_02505 [Acidobacteria bacterium]|nr:hypothetical protein [Acidobacteriota bacterium]